MMVGKALYVDGGVIADNPSDLGGTWAWCWVDDPDHRRGTRIRTASGIVVPAPGSAITNNYTEMLAMAQGLESLPDDWSGIIYSDSEVTLGRVFRGNSTSGIPVVLMDRVVRSLARILDPSRPDKVQYSNLKGHPTRAELSSGWSADGRPVSVHQVWCDKECKKLARAFLDNLDRRN